MPSIYTWHFNLIEDNMLLYRHFVQIYKFYFILTV
jgi:hypothetical protein